MMSMAMRQFTGRTSLNDLAGWTSQRAGEDKNGRNMSAPASKTAASERHDIVSVRSGAVRTEISWNSRSFLCSGSQPDHGAVQGNECRGPGVCSSHREPWMAISLQLCRRLAARPVTSAMLSPVRWRIFPAIACIGRRD